MNLPSDGFPLSPFNSGLVIPTAIIEPEQISENIKVTVINLSANPLEIKAEELGEKEAQMWEARLSISHM